MMDGFIFYSSLLASIVISSYYKKIDDVEFKRNLGAVFGFVTALLICKFYIVQYVILVCGNIVLLKCSDKRYVHQTTLVYSWLVLLHMHFNASCSKYVMWLFQTITLKLVGMGFDRAMGEKKSDVKAGGSLTNLDDEDDDEIISIVPSPYRLLVFAFYFIGIHRGPYYRWKTYQDHFNIPFNAFGDCRKITEFKLKKAIAFLIIYCIITTFYPISAATKKPISLAKKSGKNEDDIPSEIGNAIQFYSEIILLDIYESDYFYTDYGTDYRFITNVPHLIIYFLEEQITMMLCTSVFTEAGFGLYPAKCQPMPGIGPTVQLGLLRTIKEIPDEALKQEYNFSMLSCFSNEKIMMGPKMKDSMRGWNMPTRQWFWANTYKNFIRSNKEVSLIGYTPEVVPLSPNLDLMMGSWRNRRNSSNIIGSTNSNAGHLPSASELILVSACAFVLWTIWLGPSKRQIIRSITLWVYVHLEDEYQLLYNTAGPMKATWDVGYSWMRIFCLIYLVPCTILEDSNTVIRYYRSLYWAYHIVLALLTVVTIILHKTHPLMMQGKTKKISVMSDFPPRASTSKPDAKNSPGPSAGQSSRK